MSGKRVATSFLAAAMAVGTLSSAAFAENGTVDPADLNWEKPEETINISVYAGEGDQEEFWQMKMAERPLWTSGFWKI